MTQSSEYKPFPVGYDDPESFFRLSSQTARDLDVSGFAGHLVPPARMDSSLTNFLSRPFVTQEEIVELSQTQEMLRDDMNVSRILDRCLMFLNFLTRDLGELISPLVQGNLFQKGNKDVENMNSLQAVGAAMNFVEQVHVTQQALASFIQSRILAEGLPLPPMLQTLFANLSIFLERVKQIADQIRIRPGTKFLGIRLSLTAFEYQGSGEAQMDLGSVANLCKLNTDLRSLNIEQQAFSYWLRVFCAMAKFQGKCKDWLSEVGLQEAGDVEEGGETRGEGRFAVDGLYHPVMAYEGRNDRGEPPVPQERLVFEPHHKVIVFAGVNGGGKTNVARGAIPLAHILRQVGLPILGREGAEMPIVSGILTHQSRDTGFQDKIKLDGEDGDIGKWGEELQELRRLCDQVKPGMLVAIDEMLLATGQEGVEVYSREIIDEFVAKGARVLLVTHNAALIHSLAAQDNCLVFEAGVEDGGKKPTYKFSQRTVDTLTRQEDYAARREEIFDKTWRRRSEAQSV